jgi:hypothetical protein
MSGNKGRVSQVFVQGDKLGQKSSREKEERPKKSSRFIKEKRGTI